MTAADIFIEGVEEVRTLLSLCEEDSTASVSITKDNAVRRAAVVLLVSHFESFLKSVAEDFIDEISTGQIESRSLPLGVRKLQSLPVLKGIVETNDDKQQLALFKRVHEVASLWNESAKPAPKTLDSQLMKRQVTSAKPSVIDEVFAVMGSKTNVCDGDIDVPDGLGPDLVAINIRFGLNDVVKCRNDIAHGDSSRKPTSADLDRYMKLLVALADRLQRKASSLIDLVVS